MDGEHVVPEGVADDFEGIDLVEDTSMPFFLIDEGIFEKLLGGDAVPKLIAKSFSETASEQFELEKELPKEERQLDLDLDDETFHHRLTLAGKHFEENLKLRLHLAANQLMWEFHTILQQGNLTKRDLVGLRKAVDFTLASNFKIPIIDGRGQSLQYDLNKRLGQIATAILVIYAKGFRGREITYARVSGEITGKAVTGQPVEALKKWYAANIKKKIGLTWADLVSRVTEIAEEAKKEGEEISAITFTTTGD